MNLSRCRKQAVQPFVCWQRHMNGYRPKSLLRWKLQRSHILSRPLSSNETNNASVQMTERSLHLEPPSQAPLDSGIRNRLKQWEIENAASFIPAANIPITAPRPGGSSNIFTQGSIDILEELPGGLEEQEPDDAPLRWENNELVDVGSTRKFLVSGDLVELGSSGPPELGIFVRELDDTSQFFTMKGKFMHKRSTYIDFYLPQFVDSSELKDILPFLPLPKGSETLEEAILNAPPTVPSDLGRPLVKKMEKFWSEAAATYQLSASRLAIAHSLFAESSTFTYATLDEIANKVLSKDVPRDANGKLSPASLYAVHSAIVRTEIGFQVLDQGASRRGGQYEVVPIKQVENIQKVAKDVFKYRDDLFDDGQHSRLHAFIDRARKYIDHSRKSRDFTPFGTISPLRKDAALGSSLEGFAFTAWDEQFLRFFESWVCWRVIRRHSPLNAIGSNILRAIGRYKDSPLDHTTGWTFLIEMGFLKPWASLPAYDARLPDASPRQDEHDILAPAEGYVEDKLAAIRSDWKDLPVFCIDDTVAAELDDGVSIERTDVSDEYWVHIHVADPAAHMNHNSPAANFARSVSETIYMPDRVLPMLQSACSSRFSLAPGSPCLTLSARMNLDGDIIDIKITPGRVNNVIFTTHSMVDDFFGLPKNPVVKLSIGAKVPEPLPSRPLVDPRNLSKGHQEDLELLNRIGAAHGRQLTSRGGLSSGTSRAVVSVILGDTAGQHTRGKTSSRQFSDPTILYTYPEVDISQLSTAPSTKFSTVAWLMQIGNEVAAQWCLSRGIPIPYRVTPRNPDMEDPRDFFYRVVKPSMDEYGEVPLSVQRAYFKIIGKAHSTTVPGPHAGIGTDLVTKCTSPLRRYGDLLVHWQIEAALLKEAETGLSLIGNKNNSFLPFQKAQLETMLVSLNISEARVTKGKNLSQLSWGCHFLLRAWKYKECEIPSTFSFVAKGLNTPSGSITGFIPALGAGAIWTLPDPTLLDQYEVGDIFEAEIESINVYTNQKTVRVLRRLQEAKDG